MTYLPTAWILQSSLWIHNLNRKHGWRLMMGLVRCILMIEMKRRKTRYLFTNRRGWRMGKSIVWMVITEIPTFHIICTANRHWIGQFWLIFFGCFSILVYSNMTCKIWAYCCYIHKSYLPICQHCLHTLF